MAMEVTHQSDGSTEIIAQRRDKWFVGILTSVLVLVLGGGFANVASSQRDMSKATHEVGKNMSGLTQQVKDMSDEMRRMRQATDLVGSMKVQVDRNTSDIGENRAAIKELQQVRKLQ